jgi:hypothetical protein
VKPSWALLLPSQGAKLLGPLRLCPGVEACTAGEAVWLRGAPPSDDWRQRASLLPGAEQFAILDDEQLLPLGSSVPLGYLPQSTWQPLTAWLDVALPAINDSGSLPQPLTLGLVRSSEPSEPTWLLTNLDAWAEYAATAPQLRLARWSFVCAHDGRVLVRGAPLPPLAGRRLVDQQGVAVPAGWSWTPAVDASVVRQTLGLETGDCAVFSDDGSWASIRADDWVVATRSAVRLTCEGHRHADA